MGARNVAPFKEWLTNRVVVSSCFFSTLLIWFDLLVRFFWNVSQCALFFFFSLFSLSSRSFALYLLLAEVFPSFFLYLLADVMPFPMLLCGWLYVAAVEGFLFSFGREKKVSRADVLAKGERGKL
jgi:hypothetical protein